MTLDHYALCLVYNSSGRSFFFQRKDETYFDVSGRGKLTCFGGKVDQHETGREGLVREWFEEFAEPGLPLRVSRDAVFRSEFVGNGYRYSIFELQIPDDEWEAEISPVQKPGAVLEGEPALITLPALYQLRTENMFLGCIGEALSVCFPEIFSRESSTEELASTRHERSQ